MVKLACGFLACAIGLGCGPGTNETNPDDGTTGTAGTGTTAPDDPGTTGDTPPTPTSSEATSTGETTATTGPATCPSESPQIPERTVRVMLVLERSSSMLRLWDHDADDADDDGTIDGGTDPATAKVTRWSSLRRALEPALAEGAPWYDVGVLLFPADGADAPPADDACTLPPAPQLGPVPHTDDEVLAVLPPADATDLGGASPTAAALLAAVEALAPAQVGDLRGLVYVGDGAPNCADGAVGDARFEAFDDAAFDALALAVGEDIFVNLFALDAAGPVAPPDVDGEPDGVAPGEFFADAASLVQNVRQAQTEAMLRSALQGALQAPDSTCIYDLEHPGWTIDRVEVDGATLPQIDACTGDDGWSFYDADAGQIEICGAPCQDFIHGAKLEVFFATCDP